MEPLIYVPRMLGELDYPTLVQWWDHYGFTVPSRDFLPDNGTCGIMLEDQQGNQLCAGFVYFTNSKACWLEFVVGNPEFQGSGFRKDHINQLINYLCEFAREEEAKWVFTTVVHKGLEKRFSECGFNTGSIGATEMIKQL